MCQNLSFWGSRRNSATTFVFFGVVSWDLTHLRIWYEILDFFWKKYIYSWSLTYIYTFLTPDVSNPLVFSSAVGHDFEIDEKTTLFNSVQTLSFVFELRDSIILILAPLERSHSKDQLMYTNFFSYDHGSWCNRHLKIGV